MIFTCTIGIAASEPALYTALTGTLNETQLKKLNGVYVLADQRKAQQDSKLIEQQGGKGSSSMLLLLFTITISLLCPTAGSQMAFLA